MGEGGGVIVPPWRVTDKQSSPLIVLILFVNIKWFEYVVINYKVMG